MRWSSIAALNSAIRRTFGRELPALSPSTGGVSCSIGGAALDAGMGDEVPRDMGSSDQPAGRDRARSLETGRSGGNHSARKREQEVDRGRRTDLGSSSTSRTPCRKAGGEGEGLELELLEGEASELRNRAEVADEVEPAFFRQGAKCRPPQSQIPPRSADPGGTGSTRTGADTPGRIPLYAGGSRRLSPGETHGARGARRVSGRRSWTGGSSAD